jgi:hypothetical protein
MARRGFETPRFFFLLKIVVCPRRGSPVRPDGRNRRGFSLDPRHEAGKRRHEGRVHEPDSASPRSAPTRSPLFLPK